MQAAVMRSVTIGRRFKVTSVWIQTTGGDYVEAREVERESENNKREGVKRKEKRREAERKKEREVREKVEKREVGWENKREIEKKEKKRKKERK